MKNVSPSSKKSTTTFFEKKILFFKAGPSKAGRVSIKSEGSLLTWLLVDCHLANPDRIFVHVAEPVILLVLLVLTVQIAFGKRATLGRRVIIGPELTYYEINDQLIFSKYGTPKG
ncbi:hypothetical protein TYRP_014469 [Tyrophagus putrescentiae]|nr:hypothetical protein TYRP_014469 [Tyrophagus putrescentiae]